MPFNSPPSQSARERTGQTRGSRSVLENRSLDGSVQFNEADTRAGYFPGIPIAALKFFLSFACPPAPAIHSPTYPTSANINNILQLVDGSGQQRQSYRETLNRMRCTKAFLFTRSSSSSTGNGKHDPRQVLVAVLVVVVLRQSVPFVPGK